MKGGALQQFTTDQLLEELVRRRTQKAKDLEGVPSCEDCRHFRYWITTSDPPRTYNPCEKNMTMRFDMPTEWEGPHPGIGYYRRICPHRSPVEGKR
ncbi:hypothetical protein [Stenotrophomonas sp. S4]